MSSKIEATAVAQRKSVRISGEAEVVNIANKSDKGTKNKAGSLKAISSRTRRVEDMMYYTTKFCSEANPNPKPNSKSTLSKSQKRRHEMRLPRGYVDFRWVFRHLV